jgi:acyl carrier protein
MTIDEKKETVREYILREFLPGEDPAALTEDTPLISGGILDSLATLKLVAFLEESFGIQVEAHEVGQDNLNTIALIADYVESKRA